MKDVTEFLASIELNREMGPVDAIVTYQDSCHLAHGQKIKEAPRKLLKAIPGLTFREMPMADVCCGSAGIYNIVQNEMAMQILEHKMEHVDFHEGVVDRDCQSGLHAATAGGRATVRHNSASCM